MGILKLIGEGHEEPEIIKKLLDVEFFKERPSYPMAPPEGLILFDCKYKDVNFEIPDDANSFFIEKIICDLNSKQILRQKLISSFTLNLKKSILKNDKYIVKRDFRKKTKLRVKIEKSYLNHLKGKKIMMCPKELEAKKAKKKAEKLKKKLLYEQNFKK
jgi:hypothetical protein